MARNLTRSAREARGRGQEDERGGNRCQRAGPPQNLPAAPASPSRAEGGRLGAPGHLKLLLVPVGLVALETAAAERFEGVLVSRLVAGLGGDDHLVEVL